MLKKLVGILIIASLFLFSAKVHAAGTYADSEHTTWGLTACPFRNCYNSLLVRRGSPLVRAGTDRKHIGYYQNRIGGGDFSPGFEFR